MEKIVVWDPLWNLPLVRFTFSGDNGKLLLQIFHSAPTCLILIAFIPIIAMKSQQFIHSNNEFHLFLFFFLDSSRRDQLSLFSKAQPAKKRRKSRTAFTNQQIYELEKRFLYQKYLTPADRDEIASSLGLTNAQVITWFQNRRAKLKRDLEELKADVSAARWGHQVITVWIG